ncbi:DUF3465 domain-containing protein [Catenovulum sp. SM1970]|uniref:DUF3465 domain-containing protein n=1 Tax=Marinifaba aquimaris TaxID=2741323 RepID=UPI0015739FC4|nr:DUF3465 domain-containing protein [Marinifaba aquimaris]NTS76459.1 DUF3465 domain-containing protein [Marinifaba aquimaris]
MVKLIQYLLFVLCFSVVSYGYGQSLSAVKQLAQAYENKRSDLQIQFKARVIKLLPDDLKGSKHQRFIVKLASKQTLLIAHNIDLAPKINSLKVGDWVEVYGEYEWNNKGGVVHWTHHDPKKRHTDGWIKHKNILYQ